MPRPRTKPKSTRSSAVPAIPGPTEAEVTQQILAACQMLGFELKRRNTGGGHFQNRDGSTRYVAFGEAGDSDYTGVLPFGRALEVEIKRPGERPTPEQLAKLRKLNAQGGVGLWVDDAAIFLRLFPRILAGGWIEIDDDGTPYACWNLPEEEPEA